MMIRKTQRHAQTREKAHAKKLQKGCHKKEEERYKVSLKSLLFRLTSFMSVCLNERTRNASATLAKMNAQRGKK